LQFCPVRHREDRHRGCRLPRREIACHQFWWLRKS